MESQGSPPKSYPGDASDEEWAIVEPYLTLIRQDSPQRRYAWRLVFSATRWIVRSGAPCCMLPTNFPHGKRSTNNRRR